MLQGSLDNFALDEVLGLLSSTAKTGRLSLDGDRGRGTLSLVEGRLVAATASDTPNGTTPEDVVFELLRYQDGTFSFEVCPVEESNGAHDVTDVLASAEGRLADWRTIAAVVPSLDHEVTPAEVLPADEVTLNRDEWSTLRTIAAGCPVSQVCEQLGLGEVDGSRQVKGLAERGLVVVSSPQPRAGAKPGSAPALSGGAPGGARPATVGSAPVPDRPLPPPAVPAVPTVLATAPPGLAEPLDPPAAGAVSADVVVAQPPVGDADHPVAVEDPSDELEWAGAEEAAPRPPMPAPPSLDEIHELVDADLDPAPPGPTDAVISNGKGTDRDSESKPGGLLMRYLKSED